MSEYFVLKYDEEGELLWGQDQGVSGSSAAAAVSPGVFGTFHSYWIVNTITDEAVTDIYLTLFANQIITGSAPEISKLAVGNGQMPEGATAEAMTALVNSLITVDIEEKIPDETIPFTVIYYAYIELNDAVGKWTELGLLDENDNLLYYNYSNIGLYTKDVELVIIRIKVTVE